ncbi:MAG: D-tyrosyl-tRNA(Tyr) deacylase [Bacteroidales bacterium]|nr:D-tyrosyl-tRNA(Tyr) deacylase [Bacteroidales bacterium]
MRAVIQRVSRSSVTIDGTLKSQIGSGLLVLLGIAEDDNEQDIEYLTKKIVNLRVFDDSDGVMNLSLLDTGGEIMLVSQFTLMAKTAKGNRPSYIKAAGHQIAIPLYEKMIESLTAALGKPVATGSFGADMKIELLNSGPVTIVMDSKVRE